MGRSLLFDKSGPFPHIRSLPQYVTHKLVITAVARLVDPKMAQNRCAGNGEVPAGIQNPVPDKLVGKARPSQYTFIENSGNGCGPGSTQQGNPRQIAGSHGCKAIKYSPIGAGRGYFIRKQGGGHFSFP